MFLLNHSSSSGGVGSGAGGVGGGDKKNKIHVFQKKGSTSQSNAADITQVCVCNTCTLIAKRMPGDVIVSLCPSSVNLFYLRYLA